MAAFLKEFLEILARGDDLPTLPKVVMEVRAALEDDTAGAADIAMLIEKDPPLASRLLRLSNSAAFNRGSAIGDVRAAVQLLGLRQISNLCLALSVVDSFSRGSGTIGLKSFWGHSTSVAHTIQKLAVCLDCKPLPLEELYVGGLLHDVGLLILDQYFPKQMRAGADRAISDDIELWEAEAALLGADHGEIGGMLLGRWALPEPIAAMVTYHHRPHSCPEQYRNAAWLLNVTERVRGGLGPKVEIERLSDESARSTIEAIGAEGYDVSALTDEPSSRDSVH